MLSPHFANFAHLLTISGLFDEEVTLSIDGALHTLRARVTRKVVTDVVSGEKFLASEQTVKFEIAALPGELENGDMVERDDGTYWRVSDPQEIPGTGTVQAVFVRED